MPTQPFVHADYAAPPARQWLLRLIYALQCLLFKLVARRHIHRIVGLEHLPQRGPFILVANHLSYMDTFLLAYAIRASCGEKLYIPTNKKAFCSVARCWLHLAGGAVRIDPDDSGQSYAVLGCLIDDGRIVLMFPEGTRSPDGRLLPFKFGAFNLARDRQVPIVPAALIDTHRVLPKHALWLRSGERASVHFLEPMAPEQFARATVAEVKEDCRARLDAALHGAATWASDQVALASAQHLAERARLLVEALIERGPETIRAAELAPVFAWERLADHSCPGRLDLQVQCLRAQGFRLLCASKARALCLLPRFLLLARRALRRDPDQPFVNYVLGQYRLRAPWLLGGGAARAARVLERAYLNAERYGAERVRFAIAYADALRRCGRATAAWNILQQHFSGAAPDGARLQRRHQRAQALIGALELLPRAPHQS